MWTERRRLYRQLDRVGRAVQALRRAEERIGEAVSNHDVIRDAQAEHVLVALTPAVASARSETRFAALRPARSPNGRRSRRLRRTARAAPKARRGPDSEAGSVPARSGGQKTSRRPASAGAATPGLHG